MKKLKNKFIITTILIIMVIVCSQVFTAYSNNNTDTNSYLTLVKGNATLNDARLDIENEYILGTGDKVRVIGDSSLAVIKWGDGSLTRLGGNTKISIEQNEISRDYTNINISFDLIAGKTWSNVVSFIGSDSSFKQSFDGMEAGVRGTVFDVDLEKEFVHVTDHLIELTDISGKTFLIGEGQSLSLDSFSLIDVSEFISQLEDSAWKNLNEQFDGEYVGELKKELEESFEGKNPFLFLLEWVSPKYRILYELDNADNYTNIEEQISKVSVTKKLSIYDAVLSKYQKMNFVDAGDYEAYKRKVFYKKALISLSEDDNETQRLLQSVAYDLQDISKSQSTSGLMETISLLSENKEKLGNIDVGFISGGFEYLPEGLMNEFQSSLKGLGDLFDLNIIKNIDSDFVGELLDDADGAIQGFLDKNVGGLLQNIGQ